MDLLYLDYNCFQRGFDDPRQIRIQLETLACQEIFLRAENDTVRVVWSFMHEDETILCPFPERRLEVIRLATLCQVRIGPEKEVQKLAHSFQKRSAITARDAIHLACYTHSQGDFFLSCDDRLLKQAGKLPLANALNPVEYINRR